MRHDDAAEDLGVLGDEADLVIAGYRPRAGPGGKTSCSTLILVEIHPGALKHGVTEADIRHGEANAVAYGPAEQNVPGCMVSGPDRSGDLLELVIVARAGAEALVIHAMPVRAKYHYLLP